MKLTKTKLKIVTGILASFLLLSTAGNMYYWNKINTLTATDDQDTDDSTTSLFTQTQDIDHLKRQLAELQQKNGLLNEKVQDLNGLLKQANNQVWDLRTRKSNPVADLFPAQVSRHTRPSDENDMLSKYDQLNAQIAELEDSLKQMDNQKLRADNFRMVAFKRNNKETAKAKKVDKLTISLHVPAAYGKQDSETVFLSLIDLEGNDLSSPLETLTLPGPQGKKPVRVHDKKVVELGRQSTWQEITFNIQGSDHMKAGTYRASLYTKSNYLGSVEVQLRDSFWFF